MILFVCCEEPCADDAIAEGFFLGSLGRVALVETQELVLVDLMLVLRDAFLFPGKRQNRRLGSVKLYFLYFFIFLNVTL